ncbi:ParA family protein [Spongiactinospora rosea]|uniref:ParA family protein n=1 Tax=Spongiactinospora rosea TaxID=2248750 RepID=A0A366M5V1_9ACTN|nr:ParA family protein [Spongiactinospora rosea]RBQ21193.1 ParA family protein [Spongiactinospora rosea]
MAIFTLMSPGGSPGVTTTGLAVTHAWDRRALLAECDPKGGSVLQGFLAGRTDGLKGGLLELALAIAHDPDASVLWEYVISLDQEVRRWLLLPGLRDPRHVVQIESAWDAVIDVIKSAAGEDTDVVIDIGQIGRPDTPLRLIAASQLAVMVLRPTLRQVADARPRLDALGRYVGTSVPVTLCLIGAGDYAPVEVSQALYGLPVIATMPFEPRLAAVLSDGRPAPRAARMAHLLNGAQRLAASMRKAANEPHKAVAS